MRGYECDATAGVLAAGKACASRVFQLNASTPMYFVIFVTFVSVLVALTYLWVSALLHCRGNQRLSPAQMERWLLFIALTPLVGAVFYHYLHRNDPTTLNMLKH
jgi:hypothetical protein